MKLIKIKNSLVVFVVIIILIVGVPILINESYKMNTIYITVWNGADVLEYYGTLLGSVIAVGSIIITIVFTRKQIQRETFLSTETEKWNRLRDIFDQIMSNINPVSMLKEAMAYGYNDPSKTIFILQNYRMDCKISPDRLNSYLSEKDYFKFKALIDGIWAFAEKSGAICHKLIEQYSAVELLKNKRIILDTEQNIQQYPDLFEKENIEYNASLVEQLKRINKEEIDHQIAELNSELIDLYQNEYISLLKLTGTLFHQAALESQKQADRILSFGQKDEKKSDKKSKTEK